MNKYYKTTLLLFFIILLAGFSYCLNQYLTFDPENIEFSTTSSKVFDKDKNVLYEISKDSAVKNTPIVYSDLPKHCVDGLIATEDKTFWTNIGVDPNGMGRLGLNILTLGEYQSGGSSITQQVIKLSDLAIYNRNILDKSKEIVKAIKLNKHYTKEEIITMYFNNAYFGNLNYGIEAASQDYFNKSTKDLNIAECTYLVGIPQQPSVYNPYENLTLGRQRQKVVLNAMYSNGYIQEAQLNAIFNLYLDFQLENFEIRAPHFVQFLQDNLGIKTDSNSEFWNFENNLEDLDWDESYRIYTYYDYSLHAALLDQLKTTVSENNINNVNNSAAIVLGPNAEVLTMIGSIDFFNDDIDGKFNSSIGFRQPGSLYNQLVYTFGSTKGIMSFDPLFNSPFEIEVKTGKIETLNKVTVTNSDSNLNSNSVDLKTAINQNLLIPASNITKDFSSAEFVGFLKTLPISEVTKDKLTSFGNYCNDILVLEGCEISLLDLVTVYDGLKNNGQFKDLKFISTVQDLDNRIVFQEDIITSNVQDFYSKDFELISSNLAKNENGWVWLTGQVRNSKDYFTIGFNKDYTIGVWLGNTKGEELLNYRSINIDTKKLESLF